MTTPNSIKKTVSFNESCSITTIKNTQELESDIRAAYCLCCPCFDWRKKLWYSQIEEDLFFKEHQNKIQEIMSEENIKSQKKALNIFLERIEKEPDSSPSCLYLFRKK